MVVRGDAQRAFQKVMNDIERSSAVSTNSVYSTVIDAPTLYTPNPLAIQYTPNLAVTDN